MRYYYLVTSLPPLEFSDQTTVGFDHFLQMLRANLTEEDRKTLASMLLYFDLLNIKPYLRNLEIDSHGLLDKFELEEAVIQKTYFPDSVFDELKVGEDNSVVAHEFPKILSTFFQDQISKTSGFPKKFLEFERHYRLLTAGFRAKQSGRDLNQELKFEDSLDPFVADILKQKDSAHFEAPEGFNDLVEIMQTDIEDPLSQYRLLEEYRFNAIRQMIEGDDFSLDHLLGYLVMLIIVENINLLDESKGMEILNKEIRVPE